MTDTVKVKKWSYPFKVGGAEATDPQQYYAALAKANDGYYPLGSNGLWHGGVHFDEATGLVLPHSEVRCIADGQVIAYRIDEAYPVSAYSDRNAIASTGFVLVKHQLEVPAPPAPATAAGATAAPAPAGGPTLVFYSLYMHLLDMAGYNTTSPAPERPAYWSGGTYQVRASANDKVLGLNVHAAPKNTQGYEQILATLPQGTTVTTGDASANGQWLKVVSVSPEMSGLAADSGWIYKNNMSSLGNNQYLIGKKGDDVPATQVKGLNVHKTAATSGDILSVLPTGTQVKISEEGASGQYRKLVEIISGVPVPALTADASGSLPGFVWLPSLETKSEPQAMGSVVVLDTPVTIKAGDLVGHAGQYQNHDEGSPRNLVHLEVFSCDDVKDFVTQSRSKANALPADQKNLMKVYKNTKLITHRADISSTNPPKVSDDGTMTGYDLIIPVSVLEAMPAEKKIKVSATSQGGSDTLWWHLEDLLGDAQGNPISGWLAEQDLMTTRHNPWEWEGFEFIEETVSNVDHLAANFHERNLLNDTEKATFLPKVSTSTSGPVKERLYNLIDTDKDDKLTANEIRAALAKPWFAQSISQLVTKYESEWYYKAEKWDALDELMGHTAAQPNVSWVAEKKRIEKLAWWGDLAGKHGVSADGKVWHVHPVGLMSGFAAVNDGDNLKWLIVPYGQLTFDAEGNDYSAPNHPLHMYFSRVAHWPGGVSGVTIGRGYDLGQRPNPQEDLTSAGVQEPLLSWLVGAKGLQGQSAENYLHAAPLSMRKLEITRKQQYMLFSPIYEYMKGRVISISAQQFNKNTYGVLSWDGVTPKIRDVVIDLIYRGDYTPSSRELIQGSFVGSDLTEFKAKISNQSNWSNVPQDRFSRRVSYIQE
ncbi:pesticin C-terminus-like muramidase [Pseudomonas sp. MWU13-2100]|uniref:pesticin C-terminus-like muramidase n=1 Tax=Pseudomonas sp. MWU13-2100 TaxID=2935075 RepID=UPI00200D0DB9|nr:pesticin C-terminus-like muramidase [Pseudomonas sp. MWU13-2100]